MPVLVRIKQRKTKYREFLKGKTKKIIDSLKISPDFKPKYREELNRLAKQYFLLPTIAIVLFSWLFFIGLDMQIHPELPVLKYFRIGLSVIGIISLLLYLIRPVRDRKSYSLLLLNVSYFEVAAGLIAGLTVADHAYMSGFLMIIITLAVVPLERLHAGVILAAAISVFFVTGFLKGMSFTLPDDKYILYNIFSTLLVAAAAIILLDAFRRRNLENFLATQEITRRVFEKNAELEKAHLDLEKANREQTIVNKELKETNELKGKLLSMAAHDLRDPLQVILLYAGNLAGIKAGTPGTPESKIIEKAYEKINSNAEKMKALIKQTLETAVIDSGKLVLTEKPLDLGELADFIVKTCTPLAKEKNQNIYFQPAKECLVKGDNVRLGQVMENLLCNAVKFSPRGRSIWVTVENDEETVKFMVRDEGPGLSEEDKKNLFKEFQPLTPKPTAGETSTGLGLSIVRTLVKLHDGDIQVESEPGKGSTFIVELPLYKALLSAAS